MAQQESKGLPEGWTIAPIEELFARQSDGKLIHQGWSPQCHREVAPDGEWGVLKTTAIQDGYYLEHENKHLPRDKPPRERLEVKQQDFLLTCAGPRNRCGVSTLVRATREKLLISGKMYRFRVYENLISPSYLEAWLRTFTATQFIDNIKTGISESGLNITHARFKPMPVIVAPFDEQKRIVEKLDTLLAQVDTIQQRLNNLPDIIKRFRQSVLAAAVSGKLTEQWRENHKFDIQLNELKLDKEILITKKEIKSDLVFEATEGTFAIPKSWEFIKLQSLASKVTDGEHKTPKREESGRFLLSARNVRDGFIDTSNVDFVGDDEYAKLRKRCNPSKGDILISCSGSVGRISLVDKDDEYVMVRSAALIKTLPKYVSNQFLMYVLQSPHIQKQIVDASKSTAQANLFLGPIKNLFVPYLPIEEQTEIVRLVEQYFALADTLEKNLANAKQRVDNLTQSILAKAFRGELVPQDPNDEPADKLLARIKAARLEAEKLEKSAKKAAKASKK
ncbi:MAG: restriction endonuclease subunit S [Pseudoalteromonas sp.]|uniref:restriction endonuclease subunit S n=1 Tax=Pseudoalteromonas sp. TaxID=53249 RepID=UPI0025EA29F0|nr:restriction endonuclease subunit S [Pseudoalteromonas sp.]MCH2088685.1 restriction endonuclease subunit S [Pseudoalteromonas sp.]|tara:strand:- start:17275 stop:18792 length:1518 start_codon:yes stop_codon:yes gene_type:complete